MSRSARHGRWMWYRRKLGRMNINNRVSLHSNHSCLILWVFVWVYGVMDKMFPPFVDLNYIWLLRCWKIHTQYQVILDPPLIPWTPLKFDLWPFIKLIDVSAPFSIFLQLLRSLFVLDFLLLSWDHSLPTFISALLETLIFRFLSIWMQWLQPCHTALMYCLSLCL